MANMELFNRLGDQIEQQWRDADYDELKLPAIAKAKLAEHELPSKLTPWDVLAWTMLQPELPRQEDPNSNFGEPAITVYSGARFHIDVYFWFTGTTATHQHGFSGAFQVLAGSSIHSWYNFVSEDYVNVFMEFGRMDLKLCELLQVGDVQEITAGREYIHALFHLDDPSVTIVVRTRKSPMFLPQYSYLKPHLALDPFYSQDSMNKKVQSMAAMLKAKRPDADEMIGQMLAESDIQQTYHLIQNLRAMLRTDKVKQMFNVENFEGRFEALFAISKQRHGERAERLLEVLERQDKMMAVVHRRDYVTDPALRFFLAVLLNVEGRENIYKLIKQRYPDADPQDKVLDWVFDLANTRVMGVEPPNALGIEAFGDLDVLILEEMLNGKDAAAISESITAQGGKADDLNERLERIKASPLLDRLLQ